MATPFDSPHPSSSPDPFTLDRLQVMAPRVLERLGHLVELPEHGTVAGQAVASILMEEMGHAVRGPVNDVDLFVNCAMPRHLRGLTDPPKSQSRGRNRTLPTVKHTKGGEFGQTSVSDYSHIKFIAKRISLHILRTYQDGLRNFTLISSDGLAHGQQDHPDEVSLELVQGFDLNCVAVGINLTTGTLVATDAFLEFLHTREIRAQTCNTPLHTLVRLAQKHHDGQLQGAWCDFDSQRAMLELASACQKARQDVYGGDAAGSGEEALITSFGSRYLEKYQRVKEHLPALGEPVVLGYGEDTYHTYRFIQRTQWGPMDQALLEMAGRKFNSLSHLAFHTLMVKDFPKVHDLIHRPHALTPEERQRRMKSLKKLLAREMPRWEGLSPQDEGLRREAWDIRQSAQVLGRTLPESAPGMEEDQATVLFFDQECTREPDKIAQVFQAWERMSQCERNVVLDLGLKADWILARDHEPMQAWVKAIREGRNVIKALSKQTDHPRQAFALAEGIARFVFEHRHTLGPTIQTLSPAHPHYPGIPENLNYMLGGFAPQDRQVLADRVMAWAAPQWPLPSPLEGKSRAAIIFSLTHLGLPSPQWVLDEIPEEDVGGLTREIVQHGGSLFASDMQDKKVDHIQETLDRLCHALVAASGGRGLEEDESLLARICALQCSERAFEEIFKTHAGKDAFDSAMSHLLDLLQRPYDRDKMLQGGERRVASRAQMLERMMAAAKLEKTLAPGRPAPMRPKSRL